MTQLKSADEGTSDKSTAQQVKEEDSSLHDLLNKLRLLRIDCVLLHNSIEKSLLSGGICKRYTTTSKRRHREQPTQETIVIKGSVYKKTFQSPFCYPSSNYATFREVSSTSTPTISVAKSTCSKVPMWRSSSAGSIACASSHPSITTCRRLTGDESKSKPGKTSAWFPRIILPEPFQMTVRESTQPHRLTYSEKFLHSMLEDKRLKEEDELRQRKENFRAHPVPITTYVPESNFYIGKLKRSKSTILKNKTEEGPKVRVEKRRKFHSNPIPLTTFIRPSSSMDDLRKLRRHQRAIDLLAEAAEPTGLAEHSIRWHIRNRIRHIPRCFQSPSPMVKQHSRSVPDFHRAPLQFSDRLARTAARPSTVIKPFSFDVKHPIHYCWNWTEEMDMEFKKLPKVFEAYKNT